MLGVVVLGAATTHMAELHLRHSYAEKERTDEDKRRLEERNEQLQAEKERMLYDMQRRGRPLEDEDDRSAIRRGLHAGPRRPYHPGTTSDTDPSEAGGPAPSDSPPPSLPPGAPSSSAGSSTAPSVAWAGQWLAPPTVHSSQIMDVERPVLAVSTVSSTGFEGVYASGAGFGAELLIGTKRLRQDGFRSPVEAAQERARWANGLKGEERATAGGRSRYEQLAAEALADMPKAEGVAVAQQFAVEEATHTTHEEGLQFARPSRSGQSTVIQDTVTVDSTPQGQADKRQRQASNVPVHGLLVHGYAWHPSRHVHEPPGSLGGSLTGFEGVRACGAGFGAELRQAGYSSPCQKHAGQNVQSSGTTSSKASSWNDEQGAASNQEEGSSTNITLEEKLATHLLCNYTPRPPGKLPKKLWISCEQLIRQLEPHASAEMWKPDYVKRLITEWYKDHPAFADHSFTEWCKTLKDYDAPTNKNIIKFSFEYTPRKAT